MGALVGCSSTQDLSSPEPTAAAERDTVAVEHDTAAVENDTTTEEHSSPARASAEETMPPGLPANWYHLSEEEGFRGVSLERAYRTFLDGKAPRDTVVVAVIDGGVDIEHEDLRGVLWVNKDEIPDNGKDDDGNGYVDDRHGWNFIGGKDGENIHHDTYEVTRLYAELKPKYEDADPDTLTGEEHEGYERYRELKSAYERRVQDTEERLLRTSSVLRAVQEARGLVQEHLDAEQLSWEQIEGLEDGPERVQRARALLLYLHEQGIQEDDIEKQKEHLENALQYGYNPDFDPRSTVGDNYADAEEHIYGNPDVAGPDPEHGTFVAGIIAAERNNGVGIDGLAEAVRIMPIRAVPNGDERDKDVANAIRYAVDNGADVINMSFGKGFSPQKEAVDEAIQYADRAGVLMVHAAGNDADNIDSTANYPTRKYENDDKADLWIEVGASSWQSGDSLAAPFSNYGAEQVDLFAPGMDIYSTAPNNSYDRVDGTSMAAPVVTGVAALLKAYYPDLTPQQVRSIILDSASKYAGENTLKPGKKTIVSFGELSATGGLVNAYAAFEQAEAQSEKRVGR